MDKLRKDLDDQGFLVLNEVLDGDALSLYCGLYEVLGNSENSFVQFQAAGFVVCNFSSGFKVRFIWFGVCLF